MKAKDGRARAVIETVEPQVDGGRFPVKRVLGDQFTVAADVFCDGYDEPAARLLYRRQGRADWTEVPLQPIGNDRWRGSFSLQHLGVYEYTLHAWVDPFETWRRDLAKKMDVGQAVEIDLQIGGRWVAQGAERAAAAGEEGDASRLSQWGADLENGKSRARRAELALSPELADLMERYPDQEHAVEYDRVLEVRVDPKPARFSAWYELFPRSCSDDAEEHGTFADCQEWLPYVAEMGFDVLYLPPIHPIGRTHRKAPNNQPGAGPDDPGSPWAIGAKEGGHKSVHPELGTLEDFRALVKAAEEQGLQVALDLAYQCSPDHPYVEQHPEWFRRRPDGSIQYAENPPKKYQDIYPFDFETEDWQALWQELKSIVDFWIDQGVRAFRVDNPHTKPFAFWEWLIGEVRSENPEIFFLSEAFTRPKVMKRLAKVGFSQSYTYFSWRNTSWELREYLTELTQTPMREYFRPNFWPNTPDILTEYLQTGGPPAFRIRLVLAATLAASYGIYGPAFEVAENRAMKPGSEEYLNSEKYQIRVWDVDAARPMRDFIARINRIRQDNSALHNNASLRFHAADNDRLLVYSKRTPDRSNVVLIVVNLDPHNRHTGWLDLDLWELGLDPEETFQIHDQLSDARYLWQGRRNFVELDPQGVPAHIFKVRRRVRTEQDFEYYL